MSCSARASTTTAGNSLPVKSRAKDWSTLPAGGMLRRKTWVAYPSKRMVISASPPGRSRASNRPRLSVVRGAGPRRIRTTAPGRGCPNSLSTTRPRSVAWAAPAAGTAIERTPASRTAVRVRAVTLRLPSATGAFRAIAAGGDRPVSGTPWRAFEYTVI